MVVLGGGGLEVLFFGSLLLLGTVMGELLARGWPLELTVSVSCGAVVAAGAAGLWAYGLFTGLGFLGTLADGVRNNLELTLRLYRDMGLSQDQIQFLESSMDVIQQVMVGMLPALVIGSCLMTVWVSFLAVRVLFRRKGLPLRDYGPLDHWKAPEVLVWVVIACGILLLVPSLVAKDHRVERSGRPHGRLLLPGHGDRRVFISQEAGAPRARASLFYALIGAAAGGDAGGHRRRILRHLVQFQENRKAALRPSVTRQARQIIVEVTLCE